MNLKKILTRDSVRIGLAGTSKNAIIEELIDIVMTSDRGLNRDTILKAVLDRESQMSTGMKSGIAIPHGKTDAVTDLHAAIGVSAEPVDFDSLDGEPSRIFIMTVSPASHTGPHLQFLAEVSRLLTSDANRIAILNSKSVDELLRIFLNGQT